MFVGMPILNGNVVKWECGQIIEILGIHHNDLVQMDYENIFQLVSLSKTRLRTFTYPL
jgi:hypothetical protein